MILKEFVHHLQILTSQLESAGKTALANSARGLMEKLKVLPDVPLLDLAEAIKAKSAKPKKSEKPKRDPEEAATETAGQVAVIKQNFERLQALAHQSLLTDADLANFKKTLDAKNSLAPVIKQVCQSLGLIPPKTKEAGVKLLVETLANSQRRALRN